MVITCDNCSASYTLKDDSIPAKGARTTCKSCKHVIMILPPKPQVESIPDDPTQEATQEVSSELSPEIQAHFDDLRSIDISGLNALDLDFGSIFIKSWKVKVKFGLVYDFSDFKTLQRYMKEGKVVETDVLSYDGKLWVPINVVPSLEEYFCRVYQMRKLDVESGLFSEDDTIARGISRGTTPKSNVGRAVTVSSGLSDLSSVLAEAEAEVDGRSPGPSKKNSRSSSARGKSSKSNARKKSGSSKKPQVQESSGGNSNALVGVVALLVVGVIGFFAMGSDEKPATNTNVENTVVQTEAQDAKNAMEEEKERLKSKLAQKAKKAVEDNEKEKQSKQLIAQVPQEVLDAQKAQKSGANTVQTSNTPPQKTAKDHASEGAASVKKADWSGALSHYQQAVKKSPNNALYNERVGFLLYKKKQYNQAKQYLKKSIQLPNKVTTAYKWLGYIAHEEGDDAGRNQYFNMYLKSGPADSMQIRKVMNGG